MPNEVELQNKICKLVNEGGGFAKKWSSAYLAGVPDLIMSLPGVGGVLMEIKYERNWTKNTSRSLALTELQKLALHDYREGGGVAAIGVVYDDPTLKRTKRFLSVFEPPALPVSEWDLAHSRDELPDPILFWGAIDPVAFVEELACRLRHPVTYTEMLGCGKVRNRKKDRMT